VGFLSLKAFVMRQWGLHQGLPEDMTVGSLGFQRVKLIPDGATTFTRGMGMSTVWSTERGFGERSWRYSMVVDNGVIEQIFIEQSKVHNSEPDPFEVSDVDTYVSLYVGYFCSMSIPTACKYALFSICALRPFQNDCLPDVKDQG
jgi:peroxiredoxin